MQSKVSISLLLATKTQFHKSLPCRCRLRTCTFLV